MHGFLMRLIKFWFTVWLFTGPHITAQDDESEEEPETRGSNRQPRVLGSQVALIGEVPYHVSVRVRNEHVCSGAITIAGTGEQVVVTTALCILEENTETPWPASTLTVLAGRINLRERYGAEQMRQVRRVRFHRGFYLITREHDFAVLFLTTPFKQTNVVKPIQMPIRTNPFTLMHTVSGWGQFEKGDDKPILSDNLRVASVKYVNDESCAERYYNAYNGKRKHSYSLCLIGDGNEGACPGDQGAPAVGVIRGEPYLAGIYQWKHGKCGDNFPGIYADMWQYYAEWVDVVAFEPNSTADGYGR